MLGMLLRISAGQRDNSDFGWSVGNVVGLGVGWRNCCSDIDFALRDRRIQFFF